MGEIHCMPRRWADPSIDLPEYRAGEGDFLTLRAQEALEVEYAEGIASDRQELFEPDGNL